MVEWYLHRTQMVVNGSWLIIDIKQAGYDFTQRASLRDVTDGSDAVGGRIGTVQLAQTQD